MANRTFKVHGVGYDSAGSLNVVLTVGGSEVFNGAVTVGTTNVFGSDMSEGEIFTFELDESVTGDVAYQMTMTGTDHTSKLWISGLSCNLVKNNMTIPWEWFSTRYDVLDQDNIITEQLSSTDQQYIANTIGQTRLNAQKAGLYESLSAGTLLVGQGGFYIQKANEDIGGKQTDIYMNCDWVLSNGVRDGESYDVTNVGSWPRLPSGSTLNMTVGLGIPAFIYNPNPEYSEGGSLEGQL